MLPTWTVLLKIGRKKINNSEVSFSKKSVLKKLDTVRRMGIASAKNKSTNWKKPLF